MREVHCEHCNETIKDVVYVINRNIWCSKCFSEIILPQIRMSVEDYIELTTPFHPAKEDSNGNS